MKNKYTIILLVVTFVLLLLALSKCDGKKQTDWDPLLYNTRTAPYGTYVTYELLKDMFPDQVVNSSRSSIEENLSDYIYDTLYATGDEDYSDSYEESDEYDEGYDSESIEAEQDSVRYEVSMDELFELYESISIPDTTTYMFVNLSLSLESDDEELLLDFVGVGNNVFISTEDFNTTLLNTIGIEALASNNADTLFHFIDAPDTEYNFKNIIQQKYFKKTDSCKLEVRELVVDKENKAVFVRVKYGNGYFYLHSLPIAFTNVEVLKKEKTDFAFRCLSYLPASNTILWDEYFKQGPSGDGSPGSIFKVIFAHRSLTIAFWLTIIGFALFMIFRAKRVQRIIPIIEPPVNSSVEFMDTISNLYYKKKDFKAIVMKRHAYFLDYIRKNYHMPTEVVDDAFVSALSAKSTVEDAKLNRLFNYHRQIKDAERITNEVFLKYNNLLEEIYRIILNK